MQPAIHKIRDFKSFRFIYTLEANRVPGDRRSVRTRAMESRIGDIYTGRALISGRMYHYYRRRLQIFVCPRVTRIDYARNERYEIKEIRLR
jgi:hypothetical protein